MKGQYNKILQVLVIFILLSTTIGLVNGFELEKKINCQKNFNQNILFEKILSLYTKICMVPSMSTCIFDNETMIWSNNYGYLDIDKKNMPTDDSIYLVMSISKPVAATALMQLWEKELFDLDEDVNNFLPFNLRNPYYPDVPITFRMLLSHQSSLAYDEGKNSYNLECLQKTLCLGDPNISSYPHPWLENYLCPYGDIYNPQAWVNETPGSNYHYANVGYGLIEYLVEILSGEDFNDYCKNHIFIPLNMMNTSFYYKDLDTNNIAVPYSLRGVIPKLYRQPFYSYLWSGCTGLKVSINDLSKFIMAHMNGGIYNGVRILNESTVDLMHTVQYTDNTGELYGLGFQIHYKDNIKFYGHSGGGPGVHTRMRVRTSDNTGYIYFQSSSNSLTWGLVDFLEKMYCKQIDRLT